MTLVKTVVEKPTKDGKKAALIQLEDGSKPMWTPSYDVAVTLIGKPIPPDWKIEQGEYGPKALPPRHGGGGGGVAYRNTKEGFDREAASRAAWQQVEEERKDRRTALMTAAENVPWNGEYEDDVYRVADRFYKWLRTSPAAGPADAAGAATKGEASTAPPAVPGMRGLGTTPSPAGGTTSGERGGHDGKGAASTSSPDDPSAQAGTGPGGAPPETPPRDGASKASPGPSFPVDPAKCDHKKSNGDWIRWATIAGEHELQTEVCPKCGTPKLLAMEATTADLGPA